MSTLPLVDLRRLSTRDHVDVTRARAVDVYRHVPRRWFASYGYHIAICASSGGGKTTIALDLGLGYMRGRPFHLRSEKEIVVVRDPGSFEWLDLANLGYKLKVYIPQGGGFQPQNVNMSNVSIIEFDPNPEKIWSLLDKIIGASAAEAYNCIHVIEIDIFSQARYDLMVNWWCRFAETLLRYKQANKGRRVCWIMDEFQAISVPPRSGRKLFEKHAQTSAILSNAISQYRKYKVRLIACVNPLSSIDNVLRPQFTYFIFKSMRSTEHEEWSKHLAKYTQDCRQDEFILFCTSDKRHCRRNFRPS